MSRPKCTKEGHVDFYSDGRCAQCSRDRVARFKLNNPDSMKKYQVKYRNEKSDRILESQVKFNLNHPESRKASSKKYKDSNPWRARYDCQKRYSAKLNAVPKWYGELDEFVMFEAAELCKIREKVTGFKWQVDHMVPLIGKTVSGFHICSNIQVISAFENQSKNNRYWPDMP